MQLTGSLASLNKAAVAAAKQGNNETALDLYNQLFDKLTVQHITHSELFITYSNRSACHLALGHHAEALQDAQECMKLLTTVATRSGLGSPSRHPHWPKACLRLGDALVGQAQHKQAVSAFEAGLSSDPFNPALKSGLQRAQQGLVQDLLDGKTLNHKALPAPPTPERITLAPHNTTRATLGQTPSASKPSHSIGLCPGQQYAVGWRSPAADVAEAVTAGDLGSEGSHLVEGSGARSWRLPRVLLTPATAAADPALKDVFEYVTTQCHIRGPKKYLYRQLTDTPRLTAWWCATSAAVQAVQASGRQPRVLLLAAKAGLLAVAAVRAGAVHVTCVEENPYLAAACRQVLLSNNIPPDSFTVTTTHPTSLKLCQDVPIVCNCLIADIIADGVLSGGFIPGVAHALDELLVRDDPVLVPAAVTVMAQAVGMRTAGVEVEGAQGRKWLDLSALDRHRWTPSQALPSPLDPATFIPLSTPLQVWHMPSVAVQKDMSAVAQLDVEISQAGAWSAVVFWSDLQLFGDISISTAGQWQGGSINDTWRSSSTGSACSSSDSRSSSTGNVVPSYQPALCWFEGPVPVKSGEVYPLLACHNTVRMSFTLSKADYQYLYLTDPSFPHTQFAMAADTTRLSAYSAALKQAISNAAASKLQQEGIHNNLSSSSTGITAAATDVGASNAAGCAAQPVEISVLDVGCGGGSLSLLAAAAAADVNDLAAGAVNTTEAAALHPTAASVPLTASVVGVELVAPLATAAVRNVALNGCSADVSIVHGDAAKLERGKQVPRQGVDIVVFDMFDAGLIGHQVLAMIEVIKAKLLAAGGQLVPACATLYAMGVEIITPCTWNVPRQHQGQQQEPGSNGLPAEDVTLDMSALEQFRWSDEAEAVLLDLLPHRRLTRPAKVFDFDFCAPAGTPYPTETALQLEVVAEGKLNAVVGWFDLHLAPGVSSTLAPSGFTTGGRTAQQHAVSSYSKHPHADASHSSCCSTSSSTCRNMATATCSQATASDPLGCSSCTEAGSAASSTTTLDNARHGADCTAIILHPSAVPQQQEHLLQHDHSLHSPDKQQQQQQQTEQLHHHWGQSLHYLDSTAVVFPGDEVHIAVLRQGPKLTMNLAGGKQAQIITNSTDTDAGTAANSSSSDAAVVLESAPRPPWLRLGAGIEDPAVWSVKKCQQLLAQMLQRAPGGKFPPIWQDLELMQVHAGSLGLDAALVGALSQELTMQEALAVAAGQQVAVSALAMAEAAGLRPPLMWR